MHQGQQSAYGRKGISGAYKGLKAGGSGSSRKPPKGKKTAKAAKRKTRNPGY